MGYPTHYDSNHWSIVHHFLKLGASVTDTASFGGGFPDILVGYRGLTVPVEIKTEKGRLNRRQLTWHNRHQGMTYVIRNNDMATQLIMLLDEICDTISKCLDESTNQFAQALSQKIEGEAT
jgi:hypothetical protein